MIFSLLTTNSTLVISEAEMCAINYANGETIQALKIWLMEL